MSGISLDSAKPSVKMVPAHVNHTRTAMSTEPDTSLAQHSQGQYKRFHVGKYLLFAHHCFTEQQKT